MYGLLLPTVQLPDRLLMYRKDPHKTSSAHHRFFDHYEEPAGVSVPGYAGGAEAPLRSPIAKYSLAVIVFSDLYFCHSTNCFK